MFGCQLRCSRATLNLMTDELSTCRTCHVEVKPANVRKHEKWHQDSQKAAVKASVAEMNRLGAQGVRNQR